MGALLMGAVLLPVRAAATPSPPEHKVTICHRTNSVTNPYRVNTVDISSTDGSLGKGSNDHTHHLGLAFDFSADPDVAYPPPRNGDQWGDIIPPYQWGETPEQSFPGMNWVAGQAIWEAGCTVPGSTTSTTHGTTSTTQATTSTTRATTSTTQATTSTTRATTSTTAAVLPTTIERSTTTMVVTPTTRPTQVLPETIPRNALAVTGGEAVLLTVLGATLIGLGLALMAATKRARWADR
jgi:hypothetical protein